MKILIVGNMGYVGPCVVKQLRKEYPKAELIGVDTGYFAHCLTNTKVLPETLLNRQIFADVRDITPAFLAELGLFDVDAYVYLAAISNDIMGELDPALTEDVNYKSVVKLAEIAKEDGAKRKAKVQFVYASSCSVYGDGAGAKFTEDGEKLPVNEFSDTNPLTAYAKSKLAAEGALESLADENFIVTALRFATACGMSDRLRLDLMLNDFVAGAVVDGEITVLSDGSPWRPLIHVDDMGRAVAWAVKRDVLNPASSASLHTLALDSYGQTTSLRSVHYPLNDTDRAAEPYLCVNVGSNRWNYQVRDFAQQCGELIDGTKVSINTDAAPDKRSYRVDFSLYETLAPEKFQPQVELSDAITGLQTGVKGTPMIDSNFRTGVYMRINTLKKLLSDGLLSDDLRWKR